MLVPIPRLSLVVVRNLARWARRSWSCAHRSFSGGGRRKLCYWDVRCWSDKTPEAKTATQICSARVVWEPGMVTDNFSVSLNTICPLGLGIVASDHETEPAAAVLQASHWLFCTWHRVPSRPWNLCFFTPVTPRRRRIQPMETMLSNVEMHELSLGVSVDTHANPWQRAKIGGQDRAVTFDNLKSMARPYANARRAYLLLFDRPKLPRRGWFQSGMLSEISTAKGADPSCASERRSGRVA